MRSRTIAALLAALLAGTATGQDDEASPAVRLRLLPKAPEGKQERIELDASVTWPGGKGLESSGVKATILRTVKKLDEDGLPAREELALERGDYTEGSASEEGSSTSSMGLDPSKTVVGRSSRTRLATGITLADVSPRMQRVLRRDPDGLARLVATRKKVSAGDAWKIDPEEVLLLYGPARAKLVEDGSKAEATLESLKVKDDDGAAAWEAHVTLEATIRYVTADDADPEDPVRMRVSASVRGRVDGTAYPAKEKSSVTTRRPDRSKETQVVSLERTMVEPEPDEKPGAKKPDAKKPDAREAEKKADK